MRITDPVYALYTRRLRRRLEGASLPRHIGLIMDGNRRWARKQGLADTRLGHRYGAEHAEQVLRWCESLDIRHVTVFLCSTENLQNRQNDEIDFLMQVVEDLVADRLGRPDSGWRLHTAGSLDLLPGTTAAALKQAVETTRTCDSGSHVTLAIGYGGRQEIIDAFRDLLHDGAAAGKTISEIADTLTTDDLAAHLYTADQPDPDLVIRTSGEQRLSNFLLWQTAYAELYFCEAYWPAFREIDFLRALRNYADRNRRYGA
ncbi:polyprenyl diphosphate synthase [Nocardia stercoris]|uniref:Isoprenyl transferase n=1 Tax=Nocardia stercoris TaxID=2483361 RepID=A0A3M2LFF9_9NOCA|nr:polyprenyl diphosphate synthase [Nocardia stercoris]RMI35313.1 di-trans,poly-cis-decaprenylcistransferase [Nocardia stercoris]